MVLNDAATALAPFLLRLERCGAPPQDGTSRRITADARLRRFEPGEILIHEGADAGALLVLCQGLALGSLALEEGQKQNLALFTPGQPLDHVGFTLERSSVTVRSVTAAEVVAIPRAAVVALFEDDRGLAAAYRRLTAVAERVMQEQLVSLGRRSAYERLAHFFLQVHAQLEEVGLADGLSCPFPLNQIDMADVLGLSAVHVNRTVQQLRRERLVELTRGVLTIRDPVRLRQVGQFDPAYLAPPSSFAVR